MVVLPMTAFAQIAINPQIGANFTRLPEDPVLIGNVTVDTEGEAGLLLGSDFRFGDRIYIQPGVFILSSKTVYSSGDSLFVDPAEVSRWDAKLKGLVGFNIVDGGFKLRAITGPTYHFNLSRNADDNPYFDESEFKNGFFNIDVGLGVDILFLTAEIGGSFAVSDVLDNDVWTERPKYQMLYFTVGVVFGGD